MGRYDDIFVEGIATFQQPKNKKKQAEIAMKQFDPKSVCLNALNIAADFGFPMNGTEDDIEKLEAIFGGLHVDFENGNLAEPKLTNAVIIFGVYLGQLLLDLYLTKAGFKWNLDDGMPMVKKNDNNYISPLSKVRNHIVNGDEDDIRPFCKVAEMLADGTLKQQFDKLSGQQ